MKVKRVKKDLFEYVEEERELRKIRFEIIIAMLSEDAILIEQVKTYLS